MTPSPRDSSLSHSHSQSDVDDTTPMCPGQGALDVVRRTDRGEPARGSLELLRRRVLAGKSRLDPTRVEGDDRTNLMWEHKPSQSPRNDSACSCDQDERSDIVGFRDEEVKSVVSEKPTAAMDMITVDNAEVGAKVSNLDDVVEAAGLKAARDDSVASRGSALLRELAGYESRLLNHAAAMAYAREAVRSEESGSLIFIESLRLVLSILVEAGSLSAVGLEEMEAAAAGLDFVRHPGVKPAECLRTCSGLADCGLESASVTCYRALRERLTTEARDLSNVLETAALLQWKRETWLGEARLLAIRAEAAFEGAVEGSATAEAAAICLSHLLDSAEAEPAIPSGEHIFNAANSSCGSTADLTLLASLAALLWGLAKALAGRGRPAAAATWLRRALPLVRQAGAQAAYWRALALCHWQEGERELAWRCAETALARSAVDPCAGGLLLFFAVRYDVDATRGMVLLDRASKGVVTLSLDQIFMVVSELRKQQPTSPLLEPCVLHLVASVRSMSQESAALCKAGVTHLWLLRILLELRQLRRIITVEDHEQKLRSNDEAARDLDFWLGTILEADPSAGFGPESTQWFFDFAWHQATKLASERCWASSALLYGRAYDLLRHCSPAVDRTRAAACAASACQALLRQAATESESSAAEVVFRKAETWAERGRCVLSMGTTTSAPHCEQELRRSLACLQFHAWCGLPSSTSIAFPAEILTEAAPLSQELGGGKGAKVVLSLARFAIQSSHLAAAACCLGHYVKLYEASIHSAGCSAATAISAAYRELQTLVNTACSSGDALAEKVCYDTLSSVTAVIGRFDDAMGTVGCGA